MAIDMLFNGTSAASYVIKITDVRRPVLPPTRDAEIEITGRDGTYDFGTHFDKLLIEVDCFLQHDPNETQRAKIRRMANWLNPENGERRIIFSDESDKFYLGKISGQIPLEQIVDHGRFTLILKCSKPFAFAAAGSEITAQKTQAVHTLEITREIDVTPVAPVIKIKNVGAAAVSGITITRTQML
jgi:predicted phage tail component-like protein